MDYAAVLDWPGYFGVMLGKPARETLTLALDLFDRQPPADSPRTALDIGSGEGRDTLELLARGWTVTALDAHPLGHDLLLPRVPEHLRTRLTTRLARFEDDDWGLPPGSRFTLVNASYSLPFCAPEVFPRVWSRITSLIAPGGRFAGQLFGDRDSWAALPGRTHHPRAALDALFRHFTFDRLHEEERDDRDALGNPKHWQIFHIVACRRPGP